MYYSYPAGTSSYSSWASVELSPKYSLSNGGLLCDSLIFDSFPKLPNIQNVLYNDPATIVFWSDGTKTVVKCQNGDTYSAETGLAMAICKKAYGNKNQFNKVFAKWLPHEV